MVCQIVQLSSPFAALDNGSTKRTPPVFSATWELWQTLNTRQVFLVVSMKHLLTVLPIGALAIR